MNFLIGAHLTKILFLIFAISLIYNFKIIKKPFLKIKRKTWIILTLIILLGLIMRITLPSNTLIVADEYANINMAQNFIFTNDFCECYGGSLEECNNCQLNAQNYRLHGFQTLLSINFVVFGINEIVASHLNLVFSGLTLFMMFILLHLLFKKEKLSLWGAFLFTILPIHVILSTTANLALSSVFFIIFTFSCIVLLLNLKKYSLFILTTISFLIMIQIRPENFVFGIVLLIYFFGMKGWKIINKFGFEKVLGIIIISFIFLIPFFQIFYYGFFQIETLWDSSSATKIQLLKENLFDNFIFWIRPSFNATLFPFLVVAGFIQLFKKNKFLTLILALLLFAGLGVYSSFYIGKFSDFGYRYTLILYLPLIIFACYEIDYFLGIEKHNKKIAILFTALFIISMASAIPYMVFSEYRDAKEYDFIKDSDELWNKETLIIITRPSKIITRVKNVNTITPQEFILTDNHPDKLYFVEDIGWFDNYDEKRRDYILNIIKKEYDFKIIKQQSIEYKPTMNYNLVDKKIKRDLSIIELTKK